MTMPAIQLHAISKSFRPGLPVLRDVGIEIADGEMVGLIGASGSGKSTLIRLISGLERADNNSGAIRLFGETVQERGKRQPAQRKLRSEVGVIFPQFNLGGRMSLLTNVLAGRLGRVPGWRGNFGLFSKADKIKALASLDRVGMAAYARQRASQLSGGQQQRGAIARVLTQEARIVLADEPIASLDPASADRVMEMLETINKEDGTTVVVSLHQIDHAFKHCRRIIALKDGVVVFDGPSTDIRPDDLRDLYGVTGLDADLGAASGRLSRAAQAHDASEAETGLLHGDRIRPAAE